LLYLALRGAVIAASALRALLYPALRGAVIATSVLRALLYPALRGPVIAASALRALLYPALRGAVIAASVLRALLNPALRGAVIAASVLRALLYPALRGPVVAASVLRALLYPVLGGSVVAASALWALLYPALRGAVIAASALRALLCPVLIGAVITASVLTSAAVFVGSSPFSRTGIARSFVPVVLIARSSCALRSFGIASSRPSVRTGSAVRVGSTGGSMVVNIPSVPIIIGIVPACAAVISIVIPNAIAIVIPISVPVAVSTVVAPSISSVITPGIPIPGRIMIIVKGVVVPVGGVVGIISISVSPSAADINGRSIKPKEPGPGKGHFQTGAIPSVGPWGIIVVPKRGVEHIVNIICIIGGVVRPFGMMRAVKAPDTSGEIEIVILVIAISVAKMAGDMQLAAGFETLQGGSSFIVHDFCLCR